MNKLNDEILRGQVYWVNLDPAIGHEIRKTRPVIIVSNSRKNKLSPIVTVVPLTSKTNNVYPFDALVQIAGKPSKALADQICAIDKTRIGNYISTLAPTELTALENAIRIVLDL